MALNLFSNDLPSEVESTLTLTEAANELKCAQPSQILDSMVKSNECLFIAYDLANADHRSLYEVKAKDVKSVATAFGGRKRFSKERARAIVWSLEGNSFPFVILDDEYLEKLFLAPYDTFLITSGKIEQLRTLVEAFPTLSDTAKVAMALVAQSQKLNSDRLEPVVNHLNAGWKEVTITLDDDGNSARIMVKGHRVNFEAFASDFVDKRGRVAPNRNKCWELLVHLIEHGSYPYAGKRAPMKLRKTVKELNKILADRLNIKGRGRAIVKASKKSPYIPQFNR